MVITHLEGKKVVLPINFDPNAYYVKWFAVVIREYGVQLPSSLVPLSKDPRRQSGLFEINEDFQVEDNPLQLSILAQVRKEDAKMASTMMSQFIAHQNEVEAKLLFIFAEAMNGWFSPAVHTSLKADSRFADILGSRDIFALLDLILDLCTRRGGDRVTALQEEVRNTRQNMDPSHVLNISELKVKLDHLFQSLRLYGHDVKPRDQSRFMSKAVTENYFFNSLMAFNQLGDDVPDYEDFCKSLQDTEDSYALVTKQLGLPVISSGSARLLAAVTGGNRPYCSICYERTKVQGNREFGDKFRHDEKDCIHKDWRK
jgi:hypothetical protein